jgi:hypothetical protein
MAFATEQRDPLDDNELETIGTPEGDNEGLPGDAPLPADDLDIERPRGDEPHSTLPLRKALD